jgi:hypothetical protein
MSILKTKTPPPLEDRIRAFREELDAFIDAKAAAIKAETPGVPQAVIRNILTNRSFGCSCQAVLNILEQA